MRAFLKKRTAYPGLLVAQTAPNPPFGRSVNASSVKPTSSSALRRWRSNIHRKNSRVTDSRGHTFLSADGVHPVQYLRFVSLSVNQSFVAAPACIRHNVFHFPQTVPRTPV